MPTFQSGLSDRDFYQLNDPWIFGFGSLMWLPGFEFEEKQPARLYGWHRRFSLLSTKSWGSAARPGLVVALHPGGSCLGAGFKIKKSQWAKTLEYLLDRENAYRFIMPKMKIGSEFVTGVTFALEPNHPRSINDISDLRAGELINQGRGDVGSSLEYFYGIRRELDEMFGVVPIQLKRLSGEIEKIS